MDRHSDRHVDLIGVLGLELEGGVGVYEAEQGVGQKLVVDVEVEVERVTDTDVLDATIDYDQVAEIAREVVGSRHHRLIETVASRIAERALALDGARAVTVRVDKPGAIPNARTVRVEVRRVRPSPGKGM